MNSRRILAAIALVASLGGCIDISIGSTAPKLLSCPTNTTLTGAFLADPLLGGTLNLAGTVVNVPAGAVSTPTLFLVTIPASQYMEVDVTADGLTSFLFNAPATITIDYSRCPVEKTQDRTLKVYHINTVTKSLLENMNAVDDKVARKITFNTGHLSGYGVAY
jgi:hypothetical protein